MSVSMRFISAGAGSGKTYRLTELLYEFLARDDVTPGGVIATTFTNKAAAELRERVRGYLVKEGRHSLAIAIGQARIGTVNSVCGALLARFAFEAGLPPEQRVLDEAHAAQILKEARDVVLTGPALTALLGVAGRLGLNKAPRDQPEIPWEKALREIVHMARVNAIDPEALRRFGDENADQLLALFPPVSPQDLDSTLVQAIAAALPVLRQRHAANKKTVKKTTECIDLFEGASRDLSTGEMPWSQWNKLANCEPEAALRTVAQPVCDVAAMHARHPRQHADIRAYSRQLFGLAAATLGEYVERKQQLGAVDFADQERLLLDILDLPVVMDTLSEEIDLLMVDEFQDTSPIQLALFLKLGSFAKHVVWVGDVKQAIYGFRGGDATLMNAVLDTLSSLNCVKEPLKLSYRSRPALVALVNDLFGHVFPGLQPADVTLQATRAEYTQAAALEDWALEGNAADQYQGIASGIAVLINEEFPVFDKDSKTPRSIRLGDIAILAKSNSKVEAIAGVLRERHIAVSTQQAGLLSCPEIVLALACLRRLNDERDTIATAEIVSLAYCENPDDWLSDRLAWVNANGDRSAWRDTADRDAAPIFSAIQALRVQRPVLSPRESVELVIARCGLSRYVLQWQTTVERARARLANLNQLLEYANDYESDCRAGRDAATLSGFLLWIDEIAGAGLDFLPYGQADAVQVMTHHGAKGLEWPVVILVDLAGDVRDSIWDNIRGESRMAFNAQDPLASRFLRYWPWPYGNLKKVPVADDIGMSAPGLALRGAALEEQKRLLYVSFTRARDLVVLARPQKDPDGEWMATINLAQRLPAGDVRSMTLADGTSIPFRWRMLNADTADLPIAKAHGNLWWFEEAGATTPKLPLLVSPSSLGESVAVVEEIVRIGTRIDTSGAEDRSLLGEAIHACIAADLIVGGSGLPANELLAILQRYAMADVVARLAIKAQLEAIRAWFRSRWPGAAAWVEVPILQVLPNGQRIAGQIDLLLRTASGWILIDHKSTPQGQDHWADLASQYASQLAIYRDSVEAVTGLPVLESWLVLPVAGAAVRVAQAQRVPVVELTSDPVAATATIS